MGGRVVWARGGDRDRYRPLRSPIAASSDPRDVLQGLCCIAAFRAVYIADLDAIAGGAHQWQRILELRADFPDIELWVDAGITDRRSLEEFLSFDAGTPVLGSETLRDTALVDTDVAGLILSLDYRGNVCLGTSDIADRSDAWPSRIVVMSLDRVGTPRGPDVARVAALKARARRADVEVYAAGGVNQPEHLTRLADAGAAGALVGSAIYSGRFGPDTFTGDGVYTHHPA